MWCLFFFFKSVKFNCWVSPHILIRDGMCLTANKLSLSDLWQTSLSLQSISGSPAGPSKQRCSAGGEAEENYRRPALFFVALALHSTPLQHPWRWIACGHLTPTLGNLFFFLAELTSLFNSIDSRLLVGWRGREEVHLNVYPCCDVCSAWCWAPWKTHKLAPSTMAPWSNLLVRDINMEREASCERVLSEAKWLGGDVTIRQMLDNGPPSPTLTLTRWSRLPEMDT